MLPRQFKRRPVSIFMPQLVRARLWDAAIQMPFPMRSEALSVMFTAVFSGDGLAHDIY